MRFLLDENVENRILLHLRSLGHDVTTIARDYPTSLSDEAVLAIARRERRVLITNDVDFGELVVRRRLRHHGVILVRLPFGDTARKIAAVTSLVDGHPDWLRDFVVVHRNGARRRRKT